MLDPELATQALAVGLQPAAEVLCSCRAVVISCSHASTTSSAAFTLSSRSRAPCSLIHAAKLATCLLFHFKLHPYPMYALQRTADCCKAVLTAVLTCNSEQRSLLLSSRALSHTGWCCMTSGRTARTCTEHSHTHQHSGHRKEMRRQTRC